MKLLSALLHHAWLAIILKHHGTGMPTKPMGAVALVSTYIVLLLANIHMQHTLTIESVVGIVFVAQLYVFSLRNRIVGLIILIGIVANALMLAAQWLTGMPQQQLFMITLLEYVMIFSAMLNVIKDHMRSQHY